MLAREGIVTTKVLKMRRKLLAFLTRRKMRPMRNERMMVVYGPTLTFVVKLTITPM